jgi:hypothetical protein
MNNLFNPQEKRRTRREVLMTYCKKHYREQIQKEKIFRTKPNQILIRDNEGKYKIVSKHYYFYNMKNDEYDTEEELVDEELENEKKRILDIYSNK